MHATFYSKRLSQFTTEQNLFVLLTLPSTPLSKMTLAGSVLTLDRQYPEQAMAAVHTFLSPALPHHVPGVMASFGIDETHPSVRATLVHLMHINVVLVRTCLLLYCKSAPCFPQRPYTHLCRWNTRWQPSIFPQEWQCHTLASAKDLTLCLRCATPRCPPFLLLGRLLRRRAREQLLHGERYRHPCPTTS